MAWAMSDAIKTAKAAAKWSGEKDLTYRTYENYRKKFGGPSIGFIQKTLKWTEFKNKYLGIERLTPEQRMNKKTRRKFLRSL